MKSDAAGQKGSVRVHEDGTRVEILSRPGGGASITTTKPDGSSESIKIGISPAKERFARPPAPAVKITPSAQAAKAQPEHSSIATEAARTLSDKRKKVIAVGWLGICIGSIANESGRYNWGTPSLSWLVVLCATWALVVWLWDNKRPAQAWSIVRASWQALFYSKAANVIGTVLFWLGGIAFLSAIFIYRNANPHPAVMAVPMLIGALGFIISPSIRGGKF